MSSRLSLAASLEGGDTIVGFSAKANAANLASSSKKKWAACCDPVILVFCTLRTSSEDPDLFAVMLRNDTPNPIVPVKAYGKWPTKRIERGSGM